MSECFYFFNTQFDEGRNDYDEEYDVEKITKFISANSLALVTEFNDEVSWFSSGNSRAQIGPIILVYK